MCGAQLRCALGRFHLLRQHPLNICIGQMAQFFRDQQGTSVGAMVQTAQAGEVLPLVS